MEAKPKATTKRRRRIRVTQIPAGVFKRYVPKLGAEYLAEFPPPNISSTGFCVIEVNGKKIVLRKGEFELVARRTPAKKGMT